MHAMKTLPSLLSSVRQSLPTPNLTILEPVKSSQSKPVPTVSGSTTSFSGRNTLSIFTKDSQSQAVTMGKDKLEKKEKKEKKEKRSEVDGVVKRSKKEKKEKTKSNGNVTEALQAELTKAEAVQSVTVEATVDEDGDVDME